jgi:hypothetical protein
VRFDRDACAKIEATLNQRLAKEIDRTAASHPLFAKVRRSADRVRRMTVEADVRADMPVIATYDIPSLGFGIDHRLHSSMTTLDGIIPFIDRYAVTVVREYERDLRSRLYRSREGFLGLEGVVPPSVGDNTVGGIAETVYPGWCSNTAVNLYGVLDTLNVLDTICSTDDDEPDLTVLGTSAYRELIASMQPQQRFWSISGTTKLLMLNRGAVYHDSLCGPDSGYVVTTDDFGFHAAAPRFATEVTPDGRIRIRIRREEQFLAFRRYRSGALVPLSVFLN